MVDFIPFIRSELWGYKLIFFQKKNHPNFNFENC